MIAADADLLVIGGLTIDRFADGSSAPGGSVLHIARAAAARGIGVAVITVAGPEPEALAAIEELRALTIAVESTTAFATATFGHRDTPAGRQLSLEHRGSRIEIAGSALLDRLPAVLLAPVAGEIGTDVLALPKASPFRGAILQGWLRSLDEGAPVRPLPLDALSKSVVQLMADFDLLVASREDLLAEADEPPAQLTALRHAVHARPALLVSDGADGLWLDAPATAFDAPAKHHLAVPWVVDSISTVGAGDILAAFLMVTPEDPSTGWRLRAEQAMRVVAEELSARARG